MPHGITQCYLPPGRGDIPAVQQYSCEAARRAGRFATADSCRRLQVSLTLPVGTCRQATSCCADEWAGYGVTLLPKSSTAASDTEYIRRANSYRTLPRAAAEHAAAAAAGDRVCHGGVEDGGLSVGDGRYYGGTSTVSTWCPGRFGVPPAVSTLSPAAGCSCLLQDDQTAALPVAACDGDCDLWNGVDEARDVVDRGGEQQHHPPSQRYVLALETTGLLGDHLNDNMTSSRDFLVAADRVIGQRVGNHDSNNAGDVYEDVSDDE